MFHNQVFIDKNEFDVESVRSKEQGRFTERLGRMMIDLIKNITYDSRFTIKDVQNEVRYELEMYIIEKILTKYLIKYNTDRGSGFSLATSMIRHMAYDFLRKLRTADATGKPKYQYIKNNITNERVRIVTLYIDSSILYKNNY